MAQNLPAAGRTLGAPEIRPMRMSDAATVAALVRQSFAAIQVPLDPPPSALRETPGSIAEKLAKGGGAVWDRDGLRGCVLWQEQDGGLYAGRLCVHPDWQRCGIARALLVAVEDEARTRGLPKLLLSVRLALPGNRRLFASVGFREVQLRTHEGYLAPTFADAEKSL